MANPFSRQRSSWIVNSLDSMPRPHGNLIATRSGGTVNVDAEPTHVSLYLIRMTDHWVYTDLNGAEERPVQINVNALREPTDPVQSGAGQCGPSKIQLQNLKPEKTAGKRLGRSF
ncbi:MAG: hypothetical protein QM776_09125 [Rhodocyclaceae bacterium]